jgi:hypothetical protein
MNEAKENFKKQNPNAEIIAVYPAQTSWMFNSNLYNVTYA